MDFAKELNPMQLEAVQHTKGALLVIAGAGSGKTRVLTYRVAWLLQQGIHPMSILAITFTNKAAAEMKSRIYDMVGTAAQDIWISTFHSMCVRILRREIEIMGFNRNFTILDADDSKRVIKRLIEDRGLDDKRYPVSMVSEHIDRAKNNMLSPDDLHATAGQNVLGHNIANIFADYEKYNLKHHSLDFNDLINLTIKLFKEHPEVLDIYRERFEYILVDEYQDTNRSQYELIRLLSSHHGNLCVVGDEDQGIYSWRGADISNILNFEQDYKDVKIIKLEQNYRSTQVILDAANSLISNNTQRKGKNLWTEKESAHKVVLLENMTAKEEAQTVISHVRLLAEQQDLDFGQFAILYRTHAQSRNFEDVCNEEGVPYRLVGGVRFWSRREIKDIIAYLRVLVNPYDDVSLARIINVPKRGFGTTSFQRVQDFAAELDLPYYGVLEEADAVPDLGTRAKKIAKDFIAMMENFRKMTQYLSVSELIHTIVNETGYLKELNKLPDLEREERYQNIMELITVAREYEKREEAERTLEGFLIDAALVDADQEEGQREAGPRINLMTIHAAKGLEFPVVFLTGLEEGIFPGARSMNSEDDLEEERRLCYVGMTRAKEVLFLSHAQTRQQYGQTNYNVPSRFLREIDPEFIQLGFIRPKLRPQPQAFINRVNPFKWEDAPKQDNLLDSTPKRDPIRPISRAKKRVVENFEAGEDIRHKIYGVGQVLEVRGSGQDQEVTVEFPSVGKKLFVVKYAGLEKVKK